MPKTLPYQRVVIIFNPNSTGDGPANARALADEITKRRTDLKVELVETKHAGHAVELAYRAASNRASTLIVSASGDGGYHEVVAGAMRAVDEGKGLPLCAVLPSGNANDHARRVNERPISEAILKGTTAQLDLLKIQVGGEVHYAHSYAGLGLTPAAAIELNRHSLNRFNELLLMIRTFWRFKPFVIKIDDRRESFDNLVFANIDGMAKVIKLSDEGVPDDGRFEIIAVTHRSKFRLLLLGIVGIFRGLAAEQRARPYLFKTIGALDMQVDGELIKLAAKSEVSIGCAKGKLTVVR